MRTNPIYSADSSREADIYDAVKTRKQRIMIVEDDRNIAKSIAIRLEAEGYATKAFHDCATGTMAAINDLPDLLLLDISIPAGSGFNLVESIREHSVAQSIPVIFMTAFKNGRLRDRAEELGCAGFIEKPYALDELLALVSRALRNKA